MKLGRPSKYDPKIADKAYEYLQQNKDEYEEFHKTRGTSTNTYERTIKVDLPSIEKFARYVGVHKSTLYEWKAIHQDLSDALDAIMDEQYNRLTDKGLSGEYNSNISKMLLSANHSKHEKTEVDMNLGKLSDDELLSLIK